jgi:D-arabinose 1-dehydrogenase-like Zn-dependent alcohol dehydrogenase
MMRAAVVSKPRTIEIIDVDRPSPSPGEVLVRIGGSGLCGSNLAVWAGRPWFTYPLPAGAPGHEGWGRVERVGTGVSGIASGDAVALLSERAFAEFDLTSASDVVRLPGALSDRPFPGEALACAVNVMRRAHLEPGAAVAVVGVGFLGAAIVALATHAGAEVTAISRRRFACDLAR